MRRATALCCVLLAVILASRANADQATDKLCIAGTKAHEHGIAHYLVEETSARLSVQLFDINKSSIGTLQVDYKPEGIWFDLSPASGERLTAVWNTRENKLVLTDGRTSKTATLTYNAQSKAWDGDNAAKELLAESSKRLEIMAAVLDDTETLDRRLRGLRIGRTHQTLPAPPTVLGRVIADMAAGSCSGPWTVGSSIGTTASKCCRSATDNVNFNCGNQYCLACCNLLACDKVCAYGDFVCICQRSGQACSASDWNNPGTPGAPGTGGICDLGNFVSQQECESVCGGTVIGDQCLLP